MNRLLGDEDIIKEGALSFAWRTGDPNFMALFEKHGRCLRSETWKAKEGLLQASGEFCKELVNAVSNEDWNKVNSLWKKAPLWILGLDRFVYVLCASRLWRIVNPEEVNVLSAEFRAKAAEVARLARGIPELSISRDDGWV